MHSYNTISYHVVIIVIVIVLIIVIIVLSICWSASRSQSY